jgi:hypothetical protein
MNIFRLRDQAYWWDAAAEIWRPVKPDDWLRLKGRSPEVYRETMADDVSQDEVFDYYHRLCIKPVAPSGLMPGEYYFAHCFFEDDTVVRIVSYRFKIDAEGAHSLDAPMNDAEIALVRKMYIATEASDAEKARFDELQRRDWRYCLPPPAVAQNSLSGRLRNWATRSRSSIMIWKCSGSRLTLRNGKGSGSCRPNDAVPEKLYCRVGLHKSEA